jgi:hypothetical protein
MASNAGQLLALTQILSQVPVQVLVRQDAAARSLRACRGFALEALASLSWLRELDFASVVHRLPILRARGRNAERSTSGKREPRGVAKYLPTNTCRQIRVGK